ncbi:MAG: nodulation protein NfeD [Thermoproteota archaeon]|nr:nodulation protein NfeD [Candidatus Brockarchaeota archaeon]
MIVKKGFLLLFSLFIMFSFVAKTYAENNFVLIVKVNSEITRATEVMLNDAINFAHSYNVRLIIVELNTPGGELDSVQSIMEMFDTSEIPIVVFVYPVGASAWSGGTYILMASHIAVMASGTTIGSCQPVTSTGTPINETKYLNALIALMVNHAKLHSRNETIAKLFITENLNLDPEDALKYHVIELIANNVGYLLSELSNYSLVLSTDKYGSNVWKFLPNSSINETTNYSKIISFKGIDNARIIDYTPGLNYDILTFLFNPLVYSLFLLVGIGLVFIGIKTPGIGIELFGALLILLSFIGFGAVGINLASLILISLGLMLIIAEIKTGIGVLALAGSFCIVLAAFLIFPSPQWLINPSTINEIRLTLVAFSVVIGATFSFLAYKIAKLRKMKIKVGSELLLNSNGIVIRKLAPVGEINVQGEIWRAKTEDGSTIEEGERVKVVARQGLILIVRKEENA